ncbi:MAG: PepSY domain-containing protein [Pyrinomonadaceae bacterium]|nr:PepSY domain-containing protein [Pyrinomonadaceae bacterium]
MKRRNYKHYIRKSHRYLGIFIGIQFLFWTLGGLYFSWSNIKEIRGENLRKKDENLNVSANLVSPKMVLDEIAKTKDISTIQKIQIVEILNKPFYEIKLHHESILADAETGKLRLPISEDEAKRIAVESLTNPKNIKQITYLAEENVGAHHEYREKPLPAWAVTFEDNLTVYLSAETGQIGAFRVDKWRVYDFLWMLHTMDYQERDNINNYLLRGFSLLGITTILSGFLLFFVSSKFFRQRRI